MIAWVLSIAIGYQIVIIPDIATEQSCRDLGSVYATRNGKTDKDVHCDSYLKAKDNG